MVWAVAGCFLGTIIGALPGLGPSNGVAILIPLAFSLGLDATTALVLMTSVYYGAMYGGRISSILLNIPGDEPALMTTLDGYPMAKAGRAGDALVLSGVASFVGAFLATIGLMLGLSWVKLQSRGQISCVLNGRCCAQPLSVLSPVFYRVLVPHLDHSCPIRWKNLSARINQSVVRVNHAVLQPLKRATMQRLVGRWCRC